MADAFEIANEQQVLTRTPAGEDLAFLTGTALFHFQGTGSGWRREPSRILTKRGPEWVAIYSTAATASLAAVGNDGTAVNEGYAVDEVRVFVDGPTSKIWLQVFLAVRDSDGHLFRVSYQVTVLGSIRRGTLPMGPSGTVGTIG